MSSQTKQLLTRWWGLKEGDGLKRAEALILVLWVVEFALFLYLVVGLSFESHPFLLVLGALVMGWVVAENSALRTRRAQWPVVQRYIDWERVQEDLNNGKEEA